ncbi:hypothetical protein C8K44_11364 [Aminobacter sp. AP02]|nr:hypothetical protein C8K44_11364 [Aminobacter sp. AP02]
MTIHMHTRARRPSVREWTDEMKVFLMGEALNGADTDLSNPAAVIAALRAAKFNQPSIEHLAARAAGEARRQAS